jgi:hypothetical protein
VTFTLLQCSIGLVRGRSSSPIIIRWKLQPGPHPLLTSISVTTLELQILSSSYHLYLLVYLSVALSSAQTAAIRPA